jgi:hypothetical protein
MTVPFIATNDADRRPPPQINAFRQFVKQELNRRKLEYISPISSPFARMTSCLESTGQNYKYFSIGFHGFDEQDQNMFDLSYGQSKDVIGYAYKNGKKTPIDVSEVSTGLYDFGKHAVSEQQLDVVREQGQGQFLDLTGPALAEGKHPTPGIVDVGVDRCCGSIPAKQEAPLHSQESKTPTFADEFERCEGSDRAFSCVSPKIRI